MWRDGSVSKIAKKKRGPRTLEGKAKARANATTHGIMALSPVVTSFESEAGWKAHRQGVLDSLDPQGGMEEMLAERVAMLSWRLNRVVVYESGAITTAQDKVIPTIEEERARTVKFSRLNPQGVKEMAAGTGLEQIVCELVDKGRDLSTWAADTLSQVDTPLSVLEHSRLSYEAVRQVSDADEAPDAVVTGPGLWWLVEQAPRWAADYAAYQREEAAGMPEEERADDEDLDDLVVELEDALEERLGDAVEAVSASEMRDHLAFVAEKAGFLHEAGYRPLEGLLEKLATTAKVTYEKAQKNVEALEGRVTRERLAHTLPSEEDMQKIARYEAHLSKQMYQALHELEALQTRRAGGSAPLGRIDVHGLPEGELR
jgi:hypothetical protein